jgi:hypothetical protein
MSGVATLLHGSLYKPTGWTKMRLAPSGPSNPLPAGET